MNTKANGELTPKEKAARERIEAMGIKPAVRHRQKFLFKETQVYATRTTIQRTRSQCMYWGKKKNRKRVYPYSSGFACSLGNRHCRVATCFSFMEKV